MLKLTRNERERDSGRARSWEGKEGRQGSLRKEVWSSQNERMWHRDGCELGNNTWWCSQNRKRGIVHWDNTTGFLKVPLCRASKEEQAIQDFSKYHKGACTAVPDNTNIRALTVQGVPRTHGTQNEGIKDAFWCAQYSRTKKLRNTPELVQENKKVLVNMKKPLNFRFLKYHSINKTWCVIPK